MEGDKFSVFNSTDCVGDTFKLYSLSKPIDSTFKCFGSAKRSLQILILPVLKLL
jgi:hypothetical protein